MFHFRVFLVAAAAVAGLEIATAAEREMPKFDLTATCRGIGFGANTGEVHAGRTGGG